MRARWTKPQASALALLKSGRRIRFRDTKFVLETIASTADAAVNISMATMLRLARAGAVDLIRERGQLYAVLARTPVPAGPALRGKAAAGGANLVAELEEDAA
jgi:hypothetical protein